MFNEVLVVSDGLEARIGTLASDRERFMPWRTIDGEALAPVKKMAGYHQFHAVRRAVEDGATVPISYESRLAKIEIDERERPRLDAEFEEATEGEEVDRKEKLESRWAALEAMVGKAMVVCMSRRIAVELYRALAALRPVWHDEDDTRGALAEAPGERAEGAVQEEPRAGSVVRRDARAGGPDVPEPCNRDGAGDRGVDRPAVKVLGDETLGTIARELVDTVRRNVSIDWTVKETVRAKLRVAVKKILRKYGYPRDKQEKAVQTVLARAERLGADWAA